MQDGKDNQTQKEGAKRQAWKPMNDPHQAAPVDREALRGKNPFLIQRKVEAPVVQKVAPVAIFLWAVGRYAAQKFAQGAVIELAMQALLEFVLEGRVDFTDPDKYIDAAWEGVKEIFGGGKHVGAVVDGLNALVSEYRKNPNMTPAQGLKAFAWGMGQSYLFDYIVGKLGKKIFNPAVIQKIKSGLAKIGMTGTKVDAFFDKYIKVEAKSSNLPKPTTTAQKPIKTVSPTKQKPTTHTPAKTSKTVTSVPTKKVVPVPVKKKQPAITHQPTVNKIDANAHKVEIDAHKVDENVHKVEADAHKVETVDANAKKETGGKDGEDGSKKDLTPKKLEERLNDYAEVKKRFDTFDEETRKLFVADFDSVDHVVLEMMNKNPEVVEFWLKKRDKLRHETKAYTGHRERTGIDDSPDKSAKYAATIEDIKQSAVGKDKELVEKTNAVEIKPYSECAAGVYHTEVEGSVKVGQNVEGRHIENDSLLVWDAQKQAWKDNSGTQHPKWAERTEKYQREVLEKMSDEELKHIAQYLNMIRLDAIANNAKGSKDFKNDLWYKLLHVDMNIDMDKIEAALDHSLSPDQKAEALHKAMLGAEAYWLKAMRNKILFAGKAGSHSEVVALNELIESLKNTKVDFSPEKLRMYVRDKHGLNKCRCPNCYFMTADRVTLISND